MDTTREEDAKKMNIYDAARKYSPRLVAVGEGWLIAGLDDEIKNMKVGERREVELSPEKAYGKRDPTQTRMMPMRKFGEREHELEVGDSVEVDNRVGIIRFIGSGRAQVDFNHRLAGKSILYDFEVVNKVEGDDEKVKALIGRRFGEEGEKVTSSLVGGRLEVTVPEELFLTDGLQIIKRGISGDVFKFIPAVSDLVFVEKFVNKNPQEKKPEPKAEELEAPTVEPPKPRKRKKPVAAKP